jgi:SAM-dependent methyltransferase
MTTFQLHDEAQTGFKSAAAYDTGRPSYAPEVVESLLKHLDVAGVKHAKILDLAAGTGKFTEALAARPEEYEIVAVEPHDDMRAQLSQKALKNVAVLKGNAENMEGVNDKTFDAVIVAQVSPHDQPLLPIIVDDCCNRLSIGKVINMNCIVRMC